MATYGPMILYFYIVTKGVHTIQADHGVAVVPSETRAQPWLVPSSLLQGGST